MKRASETSRLRLLIKYLRPLLESFRDLTPIVVVIAFFQAIVLQQPIPNFSDILIVLLLVALGLKLFMHGLASAIFNYWWLRRSRGDDLIRAAEDHRHCLRLRWRHHLNHHRPPRYCTWRRPSLQHQGP